MAKKELGYVELEWTCPNCGTRNAGTVKVCTNCGAAQPEDIEFHQAAEETLIKNVDLIAAAEAGPDIHCDFCGARNPASAETCSRCGASLETGTRREKGRVLGRHRDEPAPDVICEFCGTANDATNRQCTNCGSALPQPDATPVAKTAVQPPKKPVPSSSSSFNPMILFGVIGLLLVACIAFFVFMGRTDSTTARVSDVGWERSIVVLGLAPVTESDWEDELPLNASVESCTERLRYTSAEPEPNSVEVCGEPYTVDTGTGIGQVVQDCEYEVYDDYCEYTEMRLLPITTARLAGEDLNPLWPQPQLEQDQELGERTETYTIEFSVDGEPYVYRTSDPAEFEQFAPDTVWTVEINQFGNIVNVEPAN